MDEKYTQLLAVKITESMDATIDSLLDQFTRTEYPTKSDLVRTLLEIGLSTEWKKITKKRETE